MPLKKGSSRDNCISTNYKELRASGRPHDVAQAGSLNFCNQEWGGIPKKDNRKEIAILLEKIDFDLLDMQFIEEQLQEEKKKFIKKLKEVD